MPDFRLIPSIEQLRQRDGVRDLERDFGRDAIVAALREAADRFREELSRGDAPAVGVRDQEAAGVYLEQLARLRLTAVGQPSLQPLVNATGVVLHTNLGRAPLAVAALDRVAALGLGYSNLEFDLAQGRRGARDVHAESLACRLTGAEAALVVNNNAAATLLLLAGLAAGREVVVSRGELVEIGGGFRVPEVMDQSGARLREVGTTNKTRAADYAAAISERTALLLRVHRSNFRIEGFTECPTLDELVAVGREHGLPVAEDLGSGYLGLPGDAQAGARLDALLGHEPKVQASVAAGVDVCCFSGDKLLGGPQCGVIVGRRDLVRRIGRHPLMRALRVDKITYAALEATLGEYVAGRAARTIPIMRMVLTTTARLQERCERVAASIGASSARIQADIIDGTSTIGGGTTPGLQLPTRLLALRLAGLTADDLENRLRSSTPPIIARIENDRVVLDLRTVLPEQDEMVAAVVGGLRQ